MKYHSKIKTKGFAMSQIHAIDVAKYFLAQVSEECGDTISNLKLQKLIYYAQGFHLALYNTPLFPEQIRAWQHGPVIPSLYRYYSKYDAGSIPKPNDVDFSIYNEPTKKLLDEIYKVYGQFSAWKLRNMTHEEPPWRDTPINGIITRQAMKGYFKQLVN